MAANPLRAFTDDELYDELHRRREQRREVEPKKWCHDCQHAKHGDEFKCARGHAVTFHMPDDIDEAHRGQFGYYRRSCADRTKQNDEASTEESATENRGG